MRILISIIFYTCIITFSPSCSSDREKETELNKFNDFTTKINLRGIVPSSKDSSTIMVNTIANIFILDSLLILYDYTARNGNFFYVHNKYSYKHLATFGNIGSGPGEGNIGGGAFLDKKTNTIFQQIQDKKLLYKYHIDSALKMGQNYIPEIEYKNYSGQEIGKFLSYLNGKYYAMSNILTRNVLKSGISNFAEIENSIISSVSKVSGQIQKYGTHYLPLVEFDDVNALYEYNYNKFQINEDLQIAVTAYRYLNRLAFIDLKTEDKQTKYFGEENELTLKRNLEGKIIRDFDRAVSYFDIAITSKYIFALYSGNPLHIIDEDGQIIEENYASEIHVYDWNRNPVAKLLLDMEVETIAIDWEKKIIYGSNPLAKNLSIVEFDIKSISEINR
ncbi:MAG: TolB-like 6-bladed beta-propeller domain-containing protein [Cyclobacteriaceae bacterium]|nr:TolB-like 6-bladed beta-propeller domain-containing protein [Cyclobacteriaceae bacterium]